MPESSNFNTLTSCRVCRLASDVKLTGNLHSGALRGYGTLSGHLDYKICFTCGSPGMVAQSYAHLQAQACAPEFPHLSAPRHTAAS